MMPYLENIMFSRIKDSRPADKDVTNVDVKLLCLELIKVREALDRALIDLEASKIWAVTVHTKGEKTQWFYLDKETKFIGREI